MFLGTYPPHSVEISRFFSHSDLREINFDEYRSAKSNTFWGSEFWLLWLISALVEVPKNGKKHIFRTSRISQGWFHVKSEWQKNPEISKLCTLFLPKKILSDLYLLLNFIKRKLFIIVPKDLLQIIYVSSVINVIYVFQNWLTICSTPNMTMLS